MAGKNSRRRPCRHYRRVKTRNGHKKRLINPSVKPKKSVTIRSAERKIFNHISNPSIYQKEFGGALDFDKKGRLENINVMPGTMYSVDLPEDYEVQYHTHPDKTMNPPSPEDLMVLLDNDRQQSEIVFRNGEAFVITKTPRTKALSRLPATTKKRVLGKAFFSTKGPHHNEDYKKALEDLGFAVDINKDKEGPLPVNIKPVE